jgi:hypothetical protein
LVGSSGNCKLSGGFRILQKFKATRSASLQVTKIFLIVFSGEEKDLGQNGVLSK